MAEENTDNKKESTAGRALHDLNTGQTDIRRLQRLRRGAQFVVETGRTVVSAIEVAVATAEIWVPLFIIFIMIASVVVLFGNTSNVNAGTPGADCVADLGGSCDTGPTCASPKVQDTTGATCSPDASGQAQICCVAAKSCTDPSIGGQCSADSSCASITPPSSPDTTGATCSDSTKPTCCVPKKTCESIGGKCSPDATCASVIPPSIQDTTHALCALETDTCCVPKETRPLLKFYCQYDTWNYNSCDIYSYGCTPTSLAMIMGAYSTTYTPKYVSSSVWDSKIGADIGCTTGNGFEGTTDAGALSAISWASSQGYLIGNDQVQWGDTSVSLASLKNFITNNYFLFVGANMSFNSSKGGFGGHSMVITDVNPAAGTITYYDPTWCVGGTQNSPIVQTRSVTSVISSWYYIYPIKK